ncbi:hypothetical protein OMCYN_01079 [cyanobiont of Ornithocercus magnificus]|nr:hypothetical protein OMCYN_01079 [cyanobiont of Ornithocercus magnificus]
MNSRGKFLIPTVLRERLNRVEEINNKSKLLVIIFGQLGDFDSLEYAQALVPRLTDLDSAGISLICIGIGNEAGANRFSVFTKLPRNKILVDQTSDLHFRLGLYQGLQAPGKPWLGFLLMCAGIGSPGTISEVLRGYFGDRGASQLFNDDETIVAPPLPKFRGKMFTYAGGKGFQRPFELATWRLRNMSEVLANWRTYVPCDDFISQRGGTYLVNERDEVIYCHKDRNILGYSDTMQTPLKFLEPYLNGQ